MQTPRHLTRFLGRWRPLLRVLVALAMVVMGTLHFVRPGSFVSIVPAGLPSPYALVLVSGFFEVALGAALLVARARRLASYGLVALLVAVFPANINMVMHPELGGTAPLWALWARLPLQAVFIAGALFVGVTGAREAGVSRRPGTSRAP